MVTNFANPRQCDVSNSTRSKGDVGAQTESALAEGRRGGGGERRLHSSRTHTIHQIIVNASFSLVAARWGRPADRGLPCGDGAGARAAGGGGSDSVSRTRTARSGSSESSRGEGGDGPGVCAPRSDMACAAAAAAGPPPVSIIIIVSCRRVPTCTASADDS